MPKPTPLDYMSKNTEHLADCPFCGDPVRMDYAPTTAYEICCCASMRMEISGNLARDYCRNAAGHYCEAARRICREQLAKKWNTRAHPCHCVSKSKKPDHYPATDPWELQRHMASSGDAFVDARRADCVKYAFRAGTKGDAVDDLQKLLNCTAAAMRHFTQTTNP